MKGMAAVLLGISLLLCVPLVSLAQSTPTGSDVPTLPPDADVRVIVDISGSMKKNDPENLRQPAVRLLARLLPEGSRAGIWTFGQYVNMLVPHGTVDDAWRELAIERAGQINSVALRTNLGAALATASDEYLSADLANTHFILLTDGQVDIADKDESANERERQRILDDLLGLLKGQGATIHTVALSDEADLDLLAELARQSDGSGSVAETADELNRVFLRALNTAVPQEQVPIENNGFVVDSGVEEFTALIFRGEAPGSGDAFEALALVDPEGKPASVDDKPGNVRWVSEPGYDLITVERPRAGQWQLEGTLGEGSRVTVVSDLRLVVDDLPSGFYRGESVSVNAAFYEDRELVSDPDFLEVIDVSLTLTTSDGRSGTKVLSEDTPPEDGVYRDLIQRLQEPGEYQLSLVADGKTFMRKFTRTVTLRPPVSVVVKASGSGDGSRYLVTVSPEQPGLDLKDATATMALSRGDEAPEVRSLDYDADRGQWQGVISPEAGDGQYEVRLEFQGNLSGGEPVTYAPEVFTAIFPRKKGEQNVRIPLTPGPRPAAERVTQAAPGPGPEQESEPEPKQEQERDREPEQQQEPEQELEARQEPAEQSGPGPVEDESAGPIDLAQLEESESAPAPATDESEPQNSTPMLASAAGLGALLVGGFAFWLVRRKKKSAAPSEEQGGEEATSDSDADGEDVPVVETAVVAPEPEAEPDLATEPEPEAEIDDEIPELQPEEAEPMDPETIPEPEEDPEVPTVTPEPGPLEAEPEPVEDAEPGPEAPEDDDIFGMEEFDLSDIDELPDMETDLDADDLSGESKDDAEPKPPKG